MDTNQPAPPVPPVKPLRFRRAIPVLALAIAVLYAIGIIVSNTANAAMTVLFTIGMLYIAYLFFTTLRDELKGVYRRRLEEHPHTWEKVVTIAAFVAFVILFVWELYLIVTPIVRGLCVYK